jgi:hypothetical protein
MLLVVILVEEAKNISNSVSQTAPDRMFGERVLFVSRLGDVAPQPHPPNTVPNFLNIKILFFAFFISIEKKHSTN